MAPELTVIIVNWNTRDLLLECLGALGVGTRAQWVCVVVDNASTDGSADAVAREFPEVRVIRNATNLGFGRANNLVLESLETEFALLLNTDARVHPGSLDALLDTMKTHPEVGIAGARLLNEDGTMQNSFDNAPTLATELLNKSLLRRLFPARYPDKSAPFHKPTPVESVIGACLLVRRAALEQIGLFDEAFFFFKEETDLCLRMRQAGWTVVHDPNAPVTHRQGRSKALAPLAAKIEYDRSNIVFFRKHRSPLAVFGLRGGRIVKLLANVVLGSVGILLTAGGSPATRRRVATYAGLLAWHLRGCPDGPGLRAARPTQP